MTYKSRIVLTFFISIVLSIVVFMLATFLLLKSTLWGEQINEEYMRQVRDSLANDLEKSTIKESEIIIEQYTKKYPLIEFELLSDNYQLIYSTSNIRKEYTRDSILRKLSQHASWAQEEWVVARNVSYNSGEEAVLLIIVNKDNYQSIMLAFNNKGVGIVGKLFLVGLAITLIISGGTAFILMQKTTGRFDKLNEAISQFEMGKLDIQIEDTYDDEIGHLVDVFNGMACKIRNQIQNSKMELDKKHLMISSLSHDLRTPLTLIIGYIEALENQIYNTRDEQIEALNILKKNSKSMQEMLDDLLELMKLEVHEKKVVLKPCDINEFIRQLVIEYIPLLQEQGIQLDINIPSQKYIVDIDIPSMQRVMRNLIINAIKYGKEGKYLGISSSCFMDKVTIAVKDKGQGISDANKEKIFKSFFRADISRNTELGSMGIGLSIAQELIELNNGKIYVESEVNKGAVFYIKLSLKKNLIEEEE